MTATTYPAYESSEIEWVGSIPAHWVIAPLKTVATCNDESLPEQTDPEKEIEYVEIGDVDEAKGILKTQRMSFAEAPSRARRLPRNGDVLVSTVRTYLRAITPVRSAPDELVASTGFAVVRPLPDRLLSAFAGYMLRAEWLISKIISRSVGVNYPAIRSEEIMSLRIPIPPIREQKMIANFLDHETARIDALIEEQQRLIGFLDEQRRSFVAHAVTKGIDTDVAEKDSGFEWLGDVPNHWDVTRVKWVARLESGHTPSRSVPEYWKDCDIPWVSLNDSKTLANSHYIDDTANHINQLGLENSAAHILPERAVVFTRDATIGLSAITTKPMAVSQHLIAWVCGPQMIPEFLLFVFYAMEQELERATAGATIRTIGMPEVRRMVTPVPPLEEQREIVDRVFDELERIRQVQDQAREIVDLMRERRAALVSSAVTGKIDVREREHSTPSTDETLAEVAEKEGRYG